MMTDPVADMLTRIRNACMARHEVVIIPGSRLKFEIVRILKQEGYIKDYEIIKDVPSGTLKVYLKYYDGQKPVIDGIQRISTPGRRIYTGRQTIPRVQGGLGVCILSTSQGVMSGREAWRRRLGGEVLCYVW